MKTTDSIQPEITVVCRYKHPRKPRIAEVRIVASNIDDAIRQAPKEIAGGKLLYGVYVA